MSHEPQRMSALYQYHNAPEVAPAHGLEYDDTVYPTSDKYPVVRETPSYDPSNYKGKHAFVNDNRPPRIIFGMKIRTFLLVALVMVLIIVGAAVGGAVGGKSMRENQTQDGTIPYAGINTTTTPSSTTPTTPTRPIFSAPTPTFSPLSTCTDNTTYTSLYTLGAAADTLPANAGLNFTLYCNLTNPLTRATSTTLAAAFSYSLSDCIEICAGYNYFGNSGNCTVAAYQPTGGRPSNCWLGYTAPGLQVGSLKEVDGMDVAILSAFSS
ncbi:hypothetical protein LTR62_005344 [Meristemomyces frigidus]|uniref:Apple domain-containing protein n=1 Tax=Meristemomyces frigidus TaxID=1508187 RepID=A0AAN7TEU5_9PEZI|nr:hypothetical protein LTR62_005344 [Meristemomyces frigidus]